MSVDRYLAAQATYDTNKFSFFDLNKIILTFVIVVCKDSYVVLACSFDRNGKW